MQDILVEIATSTAQAIGTEFLAALVKSMRAAMDVKLVFITTGLGEPIRRARSMASWQHDGADETLEYDLEGTPCRVVYDGHIVVVSEGLYRQFPEDAGYEGYIGVPLRDDKGRPVGHLAVLSHAPIQNPKDGEAIVRLFSQRAEAELQRINHEREREAHIAALSRLNQRLSARHKALREANQTKIVLLSMVAHDLRNPLSTIMSLSEFTRSILDLENASPERQDRARESCGRIISTVERMDRLIASALTQAKSQAAKFEIEAQPFSLAQAIDSALTLNASAIQRKSILISQEILPGLKINGDEDRVVEALDNLISNAIKYSHPRQAIHIEAAYGKKGYCLIAISDQGQGLTPADCAKAFGQFQRLSATPTAGEPSTGMGLAIVKAIAESHGGAVSVSSAGTGKGACFKLTLPLA